MSRRYAESTEVPVYRSQGEIQTILVKYGAQKYASGFDATHVYIAFSIDSRQIRIAFPLPDRADERFTIVERKTRGGHVNRVERTAEAATREWEKEYQRMWRAVTLVIKAKLEAVESNITTFDQEFLPFIVMPDGHTIAEHLVPQLPGLITGQQRLQLEDLSE